MSQLRADWTIPHRGRVGDARCAPLPTRDGRRRRDARRGHLPPAQPGRRPRASPRLAIRDRQTGTGGEARCRARTRPVAGRRRGLGRGDPRRARRRRPRPGRGCRRHGAGAVTLAAFLDGSAHVDHHGPVPAPTGSGRGPRPPDRWDRQLPVHPALDRAKDTPAQARMDNSARQAANAIAGLRVADGLTRRPDRSCWSTTSCRAGGRSQWPPHCCAKPVPGRCTPSRCGDGPRSPGRRGPDGQFDAPSPSATRTMRACLTCVSRWTETSMCRQAGSSVCQPPDPAWTRHDAS